MTTDPAPALDAAVQIAVDTLAGLGYGPDPPHDFHAVLAALARAGWLHDPGEVAALRAVAKWAQRVWDQWPVDRRSNAADLTLFSALTALDAAQAGTPAAP